MQVRCPHCHNPVEILDDSSFKDILCSTCGSNFSLVGGTDATETAHHAAKTIGQFELVEQLGVGAFGTVWKAKDTQLDRMVAIKIPRKGQLSEDETEKFLREARAAAQLRHASIVSVHEVGKSDDSVYIVSDYVEGADLKEWMRGQSLPAKEAAELCANIAEALHHAHEQGVIHRDLKPGNIMMDLDGAPHIMDFGLAKRESGEMTMTVDGAILGTPAYMSPEQAKGKGHEADRRSDVYSLGTMLFEMLTGELPFRGEKRMLVVSILTEEPPKLRRLNPRVPKDLETICLKCMEKDADGRYVSANDVADDLRRYLIGEPIAARPIGNAEYAWRWSRRHPARAGLLAASVVGLMLTAGLVVGYGYQKRLASANSRLGVTNDELLSTNENLVEAQQELDRVLYFQHVSQALSAWYDDEVSGAIRLLDRCPVERRHWEWHHVDSLFHKGVTTLEGHSNWVNTVAFSGDGRQLASTSQGEVKVWDVNSWEELFALRSARPPVAFSPNGKRIATEGDDYSIVIWDAESGKTIRTLGSHTNDVSGIVFSPEGRRLATSSSAGDIIVWDVRSRTAVLSLEGGARFAFSPSGKQIAVPTDDNMVRVCDIKSGTEILVSGAYGVFNPDGTLLATRGNDATLRVWDAATGHEIHTVKEQLGRAGFSFTRDGKRLVTHSREGTITVWDVGTWDQVRSIKSQGRFGPRDVSRDGRLVVGRSGSASAATVWDTETGEPAAILKGHADTIQHMVFSPDGSQVVTGSRDQTIKVWNLSISREPLTIVGHTGGIRSVAVSPDGEWIASGSKDGSIRIWNSENGREELVLQGHSGDVYSVAFSPDGEQIVSNSGDYTVRVWDATKGDQRLTIPRRYADESDSPLGPNDRLTSNGTVAFSPDGQRIVAVAGGYLVKVWDSASGKELFALEGHTNWVLSVAFDPSGRLIATGQQLGSLLATNVWKPATPTLRIWNAKSGEEVRALEGHLHSITSIAFSPDSKRIATGSFDTTIKLWDLDTGEVQHTLYADTFVNCIAFSPDGKRIVGGTRRGSIRIWDTESGQGALSLLGHDAAVLSVVFVPDGRRIVSGSADGTIKIWDAGTTEFIGRSN